MATTRKTEVVTGAARLGYAKLWDPELNDRGEEKYSVCVMIPKKDTATVNAVKAAIAAATEDGLASKFDGKKAGVKNPLRDGDELDEDGERVKGEEFKGMYYFNASAAKRRPILLDKNKNEILDKTEIYSGCWANVAVNFYPYNVDKSKGIAAGLNAVRKLKDDENLGGGISTESAKGMFEDADDEDDI
jgi:hypothetical protein